MSPAQVNRLRWATLIVNGVATALFLGTLVLEARRDARTAGEHFTVHTTPPDDYGVVCYVLDPNTARQVMSCVKVQGSALPPGAQWLDPAPKTKS